MQSEEPRSYDFDFAEGPDNRYNFITINNVSYTIQFKPNADYVALAEFWRDDLYEISIKIISAPDPHHIPADRFIFPTVIAITTDFFAIHQRVILYICDDSDTRELARKRKFDTWYARLGSELFEKHDLPSFSMGPERYFASVFFRRDNPNGFAIMAAFDQLGTGEK